MTPSKTESSKVEKFPAVYQLREVHLLLASPQQVIQVISLAGKKFGFFVEGCSPPLDLVDVGRDFWSSKLEMTFSYGGQSCPAKKCAVLHGSLHKMSKFSLVTSLEMISQVTFGVF